MVEEGIKVKIQLFEHGTLLIYPNHQYRLEIAESKVLAERVEDIQELQEEHPDFFMLKDIKKEEDRIILDYEIEEGFQPLIMSKPYSSVLRLSLLHQLLEMDPLQNSKQKVLLHPRNIFFKDMKTLKFLYRSNQWLPYENHLDHLEQYKILILSMFSRFSYEKYKREKDQLLAKEKEDFFFQIEQARSVEELKNLITEKLQKEEIQHFFGLEREKQKMKNQKRIFAGISIGFCVGAFTFALFLQQTTEHKVQTAYAAKLEKVEQDSKFYKLISEDKYDEAISLSKKLGGSGKEIGGLYFKKGDYQKAIDEDQSFIKPTIEALYKENNRGKILDLKSESDYLELEKKIVSYDYSLLLSEQAFTKDKDQQLRIGKAFAEHGDITDAKEINQKLHNRELEFTIKKKELENEIDDLEQQLKGLNEKKSVKKKEKKEQLDLKNKQLTTYKTELEKINQELGFN